MEDINELIYQSIEQIIVCVERLRQLLIEDNLHFGANNVEAIKDNNDNKLIVLKQLSAHTNQLQNRIPLTALGANQTLSEYIKQLDYHQGKRIQDIVARLHEQLTDGYQKVLVNNHIITSNLGMINALWERLLQFSKQDLGIYEKPECK